MPLVSPKKLLLPLAAVVALMAPASAQALTQGESQVRLVQYGWQLAPSLSRQISPTRYDPAAIYSVTVDPNAMWVFNGFWGGTIRVWYSPWWDDTHEFPGFAFWDCVDYGSWIDCGKRR